LRKILLLGAAVVALGGYAVWPDGASLSNPATWSVSSWSGSSPEQKYRTAPAERGRLAASVNATGPLQPVAMVNVGSQVSGEIVELRADFNTPVREGDIIAIFDPEPYQNVIEQTEAELKHARASVTVQEAALDQAEAELTVAQADYAAAKASTQQAMIAVAEHGRVLERKKALVSGGSGTTADREQAQAEYDTARAVWAAADATARGRAGTVTGIEAQIRSAAAQIETARATVDQKIATLRQARKSLEQSIIRSPVDGIVIDRQVEAGQIVAASLQTPTLFTIAQDLKEMQIKASVDEADIGLIREGQEVTYTVDAFPNQTFHDRVKQIRKQAYVVQFVVSYTVVATAPNPDLLLMPGMTANAKIVLAERDKVLRVPNAALRVKLDRAGPRSPHVWVLGDDGPRAVAVRAGISDGTYTEVAGDIEEGAAIIVGVDADERDSSPKVFGMGL
jgi:HlyD family secretion protein